MPSLQEIIHLFPDNPLHNKKYRFQLIKHIKSNTKVKAGICEMIIMDGDQ